MCIRDRTTDVNLDSNFTCCVVECACRVELLRRRFANQLFAPLLQSTHKWAQSSDVWWIQQQGWFCAFRLMSREHHRVELIWSIRMNALHKAVRISPSIRVDSNNSVRGHVLNIAPGGTSREKNNNISTRHYSESTENTGKNKFGKQRIRPFLLVHFQPRTRWCYRAKNHSAHFLFLIHITHKPLNFSFLPKSWLRRS